jgi:hypothetical protein
VLLLIRCPHCWRNVSGRQGTSNEARDDQARANQGQHDAEDEKNSAKLALPPSSYNHPSSEG